MRAEETPFSGSGGARPRPIAQAGKPSERWAVPRPAFPWGQEPRPPPGANRDELGLAAAPRFRAQLRSCPRSAAVGCGSEAADWPSRPRRGPRLAVTRGRARPPPAPPPRPALGGHWAA